MGEKINGRRGSELENGVRKTKAKKSVQEANHVQDGPKDVDPIRWRQHRGALVYLACYRFARKDSQYPVAVKICNSWSKEKYEPLEM
jgi:hypothetical protein